MLCTRFSLSCSPLDVHVQGEKDNAILSFTIDALRQQVPLAGSPDLDADVAAAIGWQSQRSATQAMKERDEILAKLEADAKWYWHVVFSRVGCRAHWSRSVLLCRRTGACERWLMGAADDVKRVSSTVCGPLLEQLARDAEHPDLDAVEIFRTGWPGHHLSCFAFHAFLVKVQRFMVCCLQTALGSWPTRRKTCPT